MWSTVEDVLHAQMCAHFGGVRLANNFEDNQLPGFGTSLQHELRERVGMLIKEREGERGCDRNRWEKKDVKDNIGEELRDN